MTDQELVENVMIDGMSYLSLITDEGFVTDDAMPNDFDVYNWVSDLIVLSAYGLASGSIQQTGTNTFQVEQKITLVGRKDYCLFAMPGDSIYALYDPK